jgi:hypothetical protein
MNDAHATLAPHVQRASATRRLLMASSSSRSIVPIIGLLSLITIAAFVLLYVGVPLAGAAGALAATAFALTLSVTLAFAFAHGAGAPDGS